MSYHTRFNNIDTDSVAAVSKALARLRESDTADARAILQDLAVDMSAEYGIPSPTVEYSHTRRYHPPTGKIRIETRSIVGFLYEYRRHMQNHDKQILGGDTEDARAWTASILHSADAGRFDQMWKDGRVWFMPPYEDADG